MEHGLVPPIPGSPGFVDQLNQPDARLLAQRAEVRRFERLDEDGRLAAVPAVCAQPLEQTTLERQPDALEVARMLRLRVHTDRTAELAPELLRELDHLVEGGHLEPAVVLVRPEGQALPRA